MKTADSGYQRELSRIATYTVFLGWMVPALYVLHLLTKGDEAFSVFVQEFASPEQMGYKLRALLLFAPFISTTVGYLLNEKAKLLGAALESRRQLEAAASEWKGIFDSLPYGVMLVDPNRYVLRANAYIARIFGKNKIETPKALLGMKCHELMHGGGGAIENCPLSRAEASFEEVVTEHYDKKLGKWFMLSTTPIIKDAGLSFAHSVIDITELKTKEKKLEENKAAFFNMLKDLDFSNKELRTLLNGLIFAFADTLDAKSPWTKGHSERVTAFAISIGKEMGIGEEDLDTLKTAAILHDIGKIGTYDVILDKPGKLTDKEFALVKEHPGKGADILRHIRQMEDVIPVIRHHHEKIDGNGYPDGLRADEIPLLSRILCVADSFDSMTADRPYRPAPGRGYAISELKRCAGSQFDPDVVAAFLKLLEFEAPVV